MPTGYRAILRLDDSNNAIEVAERELHGWLSEKKQRSNQLTTAEWDGAGRHDLGPNARLDVVYAPDTPDGSTRRMYRFVEGNQAGRWTVTVYALTSPHSRDHRESLIIEAGVETSGTREPVETVDPPRLMRRILDAYEAKDSTVRLTGSPEIVRVGDTDIVLRAITDQQRTASVIVAPSPWREHEEQWRRVVEDLTTQSVGTAATFVIDEATCDKLNSNLPQSHRVKLGSIRTFAPKVDTSSPEDGLHHRILFAGALARSVSMSKSGPKVARPLTKTHARATRLRLLERDLPGDIRRSLDVLHREEVSALRSWEVDRRVSRPKDIPPNSEIETVVNEPSSKPATSTARLPIDRIVRLFRRWLGKEYEPTSAEAVTALDNLLERTTTELSVAKEQIDEAAETLDSNEQNLRDMRSRLEDVSVDLTVSNDQIRDLTREVAQLRQRLINAGRAEDTYVAPIDDLWAPPDDILNLLLLITEGPEAHKALRFVEFTGDADAALEVDTYEKSPRYAHAFWDYVHVLYDYAAGKAAGTVTCGVHMYLKSDSISGHKCSPERHAATESDSVLNRRQWREERVLSVPDSVDPSGLVLMDAHFKPTWRDSFAPRMHYYDDTNGTGKIYIGYIGRHLTNTKT